MRRSGVRLSPPAPNNQRLGSLSGPRLIPRASSVPATTSASCASIVRRERKRCPMRHEVPSQSSAWKRRYRRAIEHRPSQETIARVRHARPRIGTSNQRASNSRRVFHRVQRNRHRGGRRDSCANAVHDCFGGACWTVNGSGQRVSRKACHRTFAPARWLKRLYHHRHRADVDTPIGRIGCMHVVVSSATDSFIGRVCGWSK